MILKSVALLNVIFFHCKKSYLYQIIIKLSFIVNVPQFYMQNGELENP